MNKERLHKWHQFENALFKETNRTGIIALSLSYEMKIRALTVSHKPGSSSKDFKCIFNQKVQNKYQTIIW